MSYLKTVCNEYNQGGEEDQDDKIIMNSTGNTPSFKNLASRYPLHNASQSVSGHSGDFGKFEAYSKQQIKENADSDKGSLLKEIQNPKESSNV